MFARACTTLGEKRTLSLAGFGMQKSRGFIQTTGLQETTSPVSAKQDQSHNWLNVPAMGLATGGAF